MPSSAAQARAQLSSQSTPSARLAKLVGPSMMGQGLSSSISGTAFLDTASITSTVSMSSLPGELSDRGNERSKAKGRVQQQLQQQQDTDRSIRSQTSELWVMAYNQGCESSDFNLISDFLLFTEPQF